MIPNKVFQLICTRTPVVTRDSPAIRELIGSERPGLWLVPPGEPQALAAAVREACSEIRRGTLPFEDLQESIGPAAIGAHWYRLLASLVGRDS